MTGVLIAIALVLTSAQADTRQYEGTWTAELNGTTHVRLVLTGGGAGLQGGISLGDIELDARGDIESATAAPAKLSALVEIAVEGGTLKFARRDANETDRFEMRLVGDGAELRFLPTAEDLKMLAAQGIPPPKPMRLSRSAR